jgi:phosphoglycerol transferase MdoB-like AlkP superfamily enzyme
METIKVKIIINDFIEKIKKYSRFGCLVFFLALLFFLQNQMFNVWLGIVPNLYFFRRFFVTFALGLILYSPALFFKRKGKYTYLFIISILVSILFIANFSYFEYSQNFLQISALKYANQLFSVGGTIITLLNFKTLFFTINIFLVAIAFFFPLKKSSANLSKHGKIIFASAIILFIIFGYGFLLQSETKEWGNTSRLYTDSYDQETMVGKMGVINFSFEDIIKFLSKSGITSDDKKFLENFAKERDSENLTATSTDKYFGIAKGKNLIIIQVESLENAVINQTIGGQEITPNLDALAKEGLYFSNYYTQVFLGNTADAEFTTMDSLYPLPDDVVFVDYAQDKYEALPQMLDDNGYDTYSLHGDVPSFWNRSNIYPQLGYDKAFGLSDFVVTRPVGEGPSDLGDEDLFSQSLTKLEQFKAPFMATVITMSSHTPFILPSDLNTLQIPSNTNLNTTQKNYVESVHYADKAIGEFIDGLKKDGLYNNSIIAIFGDHESYTNIWQPLGTGANDLPGLADSHIPLIIIDPGTNLQGEITTPGSHLDFFPTIANLLGIVPPKTVLGQDILNTKNPVVVKRNVDTGDMNTILTDDFSFEMNADGIFNDSTCLKMPEKTVVPVNNCLNLYNQESDVTRASDIMIRGDLVDTLLK